jgi:hypothetical protein
MNWLIMKNALWALGSKGICYKLLVQHQHGALERVCLYQQVHFMYCIFCVCVVVSFIYSCMIYLIKKPSGCGGG